MANPKFSDEFKMNAIKLANNRGDRSLLDVVVNGCVKVRSYFFAILQKCGKKPKYRTLTQPLTGLQVKKSDRDEMRIGDRHE